MRSVAVVVVVAFASRAAADQGKCPDPPDPKVDACKPKHVPPPEVPQPVIARIIGKTVNGSEHFLNVGAGESDGIKKTWKGVITTGADHRAVPNGEVVILRVAHKVTVVKTRLDVAVGSNYHVRFTPP